MNRSKLYSLLKIIEVSKLIERLTRCECNVSLGRTINEHSQLAVVRLFLRPNYNDYDKSNNTDDNDINSRLSRWAVFDNNDVYLLRLGRRGGLGDEWEGKGQQQLVTAGRDHNGDDRHGRDIYCKRCERRS